MRTYTRSFAGSKLEKKYFFLVFSPASSKAMTLANAQGAFRGSGNFPVNVKAISDHAYDPSTTSEHPLQPAVDIPSSLMEPNATISNSAVSDPDGQSAAIGLSNKLSAVIGSRPQPKRTQYQVPATSHSQQPMVRLHLWPLKLQLNLQSFHH